MNRTWRESSYKVHGESSYFHFSKRRQILALFFPIIFLFFHSENNNYICRIFKKIEEYILVFFFTYFDPPYFATFDNLTHKSPKSTAKKTIHDSRKCLPPIKRKSLWSIISSYIILRSHFLRFFGFWASVLRFYLVFAYMTTSSSHPRIRACFESHFL